MSNRYFVETSDGTRYGPANLTTLREWAAQGRLQPETMLVPEAGGDHVRAESLGLFETGGAAHVSAPPPVTPPAGAAPVGTPYIPSAKPGRSPLLIVGIVLGGMCLCSVPLLGAIIFPVFAQARTAAKRTQSLSNIKRMGTGMAIYQADFDDRFPLHMESAKSLEPAISRYVKDPQVFAPVEGRGGEVRGDRRMNGRSVLAIAEPGRAIMLYESAVEERNGRIAVCHVDTSARMVPQASITSLLAPDPFAGIKDESELEKMYRSP